MVQWGATLCCAKGENRVTGSMEERGQGCVSLKKATPQLESENQGEYAMMGGGN